MNAPTIHTSSVANGGSYLPDGFIPSKHEVIVGRGKRVLHHPGNTKLRLLVQSEIEAYSAAKNRAGKTEIISRVFKAVVADSTIGFVKRDAATKKYFKMEYTASKTTIAQYFRDALADEYKSSKQYKQKRRDAEKKDAPTPVNEESKALPMARELVADSLYIGYSSLPHLSLSGVRSGTTCAGDLQSILSSASAVLDPQNFDWSHIPQVELETEQAAFSSLFSAFCPDLDLSNNPFEPTPISEKGRTEPV